MLQLSPQQAVGLELLLWQQGYDCYSDGDFGDFYNEWEKDGVRVGVMGTSEGFSAQFDFLALPILHEISNY